MSSPLRKYKMPTAAVTNPQMIKNQRKKSFVFIMGANSVGVPDIAQTAKHKALPHIAKRATIT